MNTQKCVTYLRGGRVRVAELSVRCHRDDHMGGFTQNTVFTSLYKHGRIDYLISIISNSNISQFVVCAAVLWRAAIPARQRAGARAFRMPDPH